MSGKIEKYFLACVNNRAEFLRSVLAVEISYKKYPFNKSLGGVARLPTPKCYNAPRYTYYYY